MDTFARDMRAAIDQTEDRLSRVWVFYRVSAQASMASAGSRHLLFVTVYLREDSGLLPRVEGLPPETRAYPWADVGSRVARVRLQEGEKPPFDAVAQNFLLKRDLDGELLQVNGAPMLVAETQYMEFSGGNDEVFSVCSLLGKALENF